MVCRKRSCYDTRNCFIDSLASRRHSLQFVTWPISIFQPDTEKNLPVPCTGRRSLMTPTHRPTHRPAARRWRSPRARPGPAAAPPGPARPGLPAALARGSSRQARPPRDGGQGPAGTLRGRSGGCRARASRCEAAPRG